MESHGSRITASVLFNDCRWSQEHPYEEQAHAPLWSWSPTGMAKWQSTPCAFFSASHCRRQGMGLRNRVSSMPHTFDISTALEQPFTTMILILVSALTACPSCRDPPCSTWPSLTLTLTLPACRALRGRKVLSTWPSYHRHPCLPAEASNRQCRSEVVLVSSSTSP